MDIRTRPVARYQTLGLLQMKCYSEFPCADVDIIAKKIYNFLETQTDLITVCHPGWHFIDCKSVLAHTPELADFFRLHKLILQPIVLNSQIMHSVEKRWLDANAPRIIASFCHFITNHYTY